jgi:photosystem II stability/assembly factor-like uncharacterized protein
MAVVVCFGAIVAGLATLLTARSGGAASATSKITTAVGPTRFISPDFGYSVAYREVWRGDTADTTVGLFVYKSGRWSNVTPPTLHANSIDDVAFIDRDHGWVAAYNCGEAAVHLYRTRNGGRSWRSLGRPGSHSCGGGPTFLSFVDARIGWMEPVSSNGPAGELLRTTDGGTNWTLVASLHDKNPRLPCLAPIAFISRSAGWMGRASTGGPGCWAYVYETKTAGRTWQAHAIRMPGPSGEQMLDVPQFFGRSGVIAATLGTRSARAVAFAASDDGGHTWSLRSLRSISSCAPRGSSWPTSVASKRVWWSVSGRHQTFVQVTSDAGRHWHRIAARGLPARRCAVI